MGNKTSKPGLKNDVDKNKGSGSGSGSPSAVLFFVSGESDCEERTVVWKITDFAEVLESWNEALAENGIAFEAGTCLLQDGTKAPATWKFYFQHSKKDDVDGVGGFLSLNLKGSRAKSAKALYSVSLSSGGNLISSFRNGRKEFTTSSWGWHKMMTKSEFLDKTKGTNTLEVTLQVKVFYSPHGLKPVLQKGSGSSSPATPSDLMQLRESEVIKDLEKLLESGVGADIEVTVPKEAGGEVDEDFYTRKVHKGILMVRSPVFAKMFAPESTMLETQTGKVVIKDMSPKGLDIFLHYLYTEKVLDGWVKVPEEIFNCAEKYDLRRLKQFCGDNLMAAVTTRNALALHEALKLHNLPEALSALENFISKNTKAVLNPGEQREEEQGTCDSVDNSVALADLIELDSDTDTDSDM